ncbi:MAG: alpha-amylase [Syntrophomonadaceae bacterium]|nr:alpha-amylase [Syntrophomonadaceae bacterium]
MSNVKYLTPKKSLEELGSTARRATNAQAVAEIVFVKMAQEAQLDDVTISEYPDLFVQWDENWRGKAGDIVRDEGALYRSIHDVNDAGQNRKPSETPSMWTHIGDPGEEFPTWIQPIGAHDAYSKGAKVSHGGGKWVSDVDGNVWEPGVYGWTQQTA